VDAAAGGAVVVSAGRDRTAPARGGKAGAPAPVRAAANPLRSDSGGEGLLAPAGASAAASDAGGALSGPAATAKLRAAKAHAQADLVASHVAQAATKRHTQAGRAAASLAAAATTAMAALETYGTLHLSDLIEPAQLGRPPPARGGRGSGRAGGSVVDAVGDSIMGSSILGRHARDPSPDLSPRSRRLAVPLPLLALPPPRGGEGEPPPAAQ
jgi:hypothetical protein